MSTLISIKNLSCSYNNGDSTVLKVENLSFEKGKVYFVIGKSGIGKSTLLEAVGLMSDTISHDSSNEINYKEASGNISLKDFWSSNKIANFRAQNYSFIFQNNNLMENFTAGENMSFGMLLNGETLESAKDKICKTMLSVDLPLDLYDRPIMNLSGGQRQRLSFVRAITAPFNVLFGDEPTGNLDPVVSKKLMQVLKTEIQSHDKTAIIVSHNIELAVLFADYIMVIEPGQTSEGYLSNSSIISRNENGDWTDQDGSGIKDAQAYLNLRIS